MKVSVCMATYNGEKYIKEQLDSILSQLGKDDELIITDDISTDSTVSIIKSLNDKRINIFVNDKRLGVTANFNESLSKASGDVIFLSDQDDIWLDSKVNKCLIVLETYDFVVTNCKVVNDDLSVVHESYFEVVNSNKGFVKNLYRSTYLGCCLAFNRKVLDSILPIPSSLLMYHDWWIGFIAERKFNVYFDDTPLSLYRRHIDATSSTVGRSKNSFVFKIKSRVQLLFLGFKRIYELR